jgi:hypothetical protein
MWLVEEGGTAGFRIPNPALIPPEDSTDPSVVDRVTGRYKIISSFEGCAAGEILGISHSIP